MTKQKAFTLIELLVVVAIIVVSANITILRCPDVGLVATAFRSFPALRFRRGVDFGFDFGPRRGTWTRTASLMRIRYKGGICGGWGTTPHGTI